MKEANMASLLSLNLNGRFRSGAEAHRIGQAVLQRLLRGTDILIGQQAHFQPCLPGNYRMVGSPSAFVAYNCQLYTATELGRVQCLVHSKFSELPASNWTAAKVFFEQTSQEILVVSWFTDDSIRSKKRSEALLKRLLGAATEFSSSSGLPFLIGGSFNVSMEDANAILRNSGFTGVRCYGYWLDSMRRSVRASSLFICVEADVDLVHVRPRSLSGNLCLGYRNDNWINPEDSFFWDPLSAKITITKATATTMMSQVFVPSESPTSPPKSSINKDIATTASKLRDTQRKIRRQNFDVIRTAKNYDTSSSSSMVSTLTHFALGLQQSSSQEEGDETPRYANPALLAISQTAAAKRKQTAQRQTCAQSEEAYETEELREILTRLRADREVRIGEEEKRGKGENESIEASSSSAEEYDFGEYFVDHSRIFLTQQQDDPDRMSSGQFSRKLSTISESGESSCSSYRDNDHYNDDDDNDDGSLHIELDDSEGTPGVSSVEASNDDDRTKDRIRRKDNNTSSNSNKRGSLDGYTADESAEEKVGITCNSSSSASSSSVVRVSSSSSSKQSSQEERIVEGSSDVDQDDNRSSALSFAGRYVCRAAREEEEKKREEEEEEKPKKLRSKEGPEERAAVKNYENHVDAFEENCSSISEFYEETNFESNFACRLL